MAKAARRTVDGREIIVQADVSNEEQVKQMFATTIEEFGRLDILVNNAGIQKPCAEPRNREPRISTASSRSICAGPSCARARPSATFSRARAAASF